MTTICISGNNYCLTIYPTYFRLCRPLRRSHLEMDRFRVKVTVLGNLDYLLGLSTGSSAYDSHENTFGAHFGTIPRQILLGRTGFAMINSTQTSHVILSD